MTTFTVGTAAELSAALSKAAGGDRIELKAGNYGTVKLSGTSFASGVTIAAQNKAAPPVFDTMQMMNCKNITLDSVKFNFVPNSSTMEWTPALDVRSSSGIGVINSAFIGGNAVAGSPSAVSNQGIQGWPVGRGMSFTTCSNINITNNKMTGFTHSIRFIDVDGAQVNNNDMSGFRKVPIGGADIDNFTVNGNYLHDAKPWNYGKNGDHGDFIHFWTRPNQPDANQNLTIKNNFMDQGKGYGIMGIFINDQTGKAFQNVFIEDNVIRTSHTQGMRLEGIHGGTISNNTVIGTAQTPTVKAQIIFDHGNLNLLVDKNIYMGTGGNQVPKFAASNIVFGTNLTVQMQSALKPNYAGNIFVDGMNSAPSLGSFLVKAGTAGAGLGAIINGTTTGTTGPAGPSGGTVVPPSGGTTGDTAGTTTAPVKTVGAVTTNAVVLTSASDKMAAVTDKAVNGASDKIVTGTTDKAADGSSVKIADVAPDKVVDKLADGNATHDGAGLKDGDGAGAGDGLQDGDGVKDGAGDGLKDGDGVKLGDGLKDGDNAGDGVKAGDGDGARDGGPVKIAISGDSLHIAKFFAASDAGDAVASGRAAPKIHGDSFDFRGMTKAAAPESVKMTDAIKFDGHAGRDGEDSHRGGDHAVARDHALPDGATDHFAFVDGHHPVGDLLQA